MHPDLRRRTDVFAPVALFVHDITLSLSSLNIALYALLHREIHVIPVLLWDQSKM